MSTSTQSLSSDTREYLMHIGGERIGAASGRVFESINPASQETWALIPDAGPEDIDRAVAAARKAFEDPAWTGLTASARGVLLTKLADLVDEHADRLAAIETRDNGKLLREMTAQTNALGRWYRFFGGLADKIDGVVPPIDFPTVLNYTTREPMGVVGAIVPWNSPLLLATFKLAPALAAGNTIVIKPSEYTSASLLELVELFGEAGFPPGVVNVVTGAGGDAGAALTGHPGIDHISFTGGPQTAQAIARSAADNLTPTTFELGGKSANIVFEDAHLDAAEAGVLAGVFAASGQTCIAGSRLLVQRSIADEFVARIIERTNAIRMGDPSDPETQMGPMANTDQLERITKMVEDAKAGGATVLAGGSAPSDPSLGDGLYYSPTVLGDVTPDSVIAQTEVFGPVLVVLPFDDEEGAIEIANSTRYGLAAGIWSRDIKRAHRVARAVRAGTVWLNTYRAISPLSPFGGSGLSGYGRENGIEGIAAHTRTKSTWVELSETIQDPFVLKV